MIKVPTPHAPLITDVSSIPLQTTHIHDTDRSRQTSQEPETKQLEFCLESSDKKEDALKSNENSDKKEDVLKSNCNDYKKEKNAAPNQAATGGSSLPPTPSATSGIANVNLHDVYTKLSMYQQRGDPVKNYLTQLKELLTQAYHCLNNPAALHPITQQIGQVFQHVSQYQLDNTPDVQALMGQALFFVKACQQPAPPPPVVPQRRESAPVHPANPHNFYANPHSSSFNTMPPQDLANLHQKLQNLHSRPMNMQQMFSQKAESEDQYSLTDGDNSEKPRKTKLQITNVSPGGSERSVSVRKEEHAPAQQQPQSSSPVSSPNKQLGRFKISAVEEHDDDRNREKEKDKDKEREKERDRERVEKEKEVAVPTPVMENYHPIAQTGMQTSTSTTISGMIHHLDNESGYVSTKNTDIDTMSESESNALESQQESQVARNNQYPALNQQLFSVESTAAYGSTSSHRSKEMSELDALLMQHPLYDPERVGCFTDMTLKFKLIFITANIIRPYTYNQAKKKTFCKYLTEIFNQNHENLE